MGVCKYGWKTYSPYYIILVMYSVLVQAIKSFSVNTTFSNHIIIIVI